MEYELKLTVISADKDKLLSAVQDGIKANTWFNFELDKYAKKGIVPDNLKGALSIMLSALSSPLNYHENDNAIMCSVDLYDVGYGIDSIAEKLFNDISGYLNDGSRLYIRTTYSDSEFDDDGKPYYEIKRFDIKNGKVI